MSDLYISDEALLKRIHNKANLLNDPNIAPKSPGNNPEKTALDDEKRANIAVMAKLYGVGATARKFGLEPRTISNYIHQPATKELKLRIEEKLAALREKAIDITDAALDAITPEKLERLKPESAASVAAKAAVIIEKTRPAEEQRQINAPIFVFANKPADESEYQTVDAEVVE